MTTQMVDKSNFDNKQYKADLQCAYDCGYAKGQIDILEKLKAEIKENAECKVTEKSVRYVKLADVLAILDKPISKLKGEQNEQKTGEKAI